MNHPSPSGEHPSRALLRRFLRGRVSTGEVRVVVPHLVERCPVCLEGLRSLKNDAEAAGPSALALPPRAGEETAESPSIGPIGELVSCALEGLEEERRRGREELARIEGSGSQAPPSLDDLQPLLDDPRNRTWGMVEVLLDECQQQSSEDPRRAGQLAEAAIELARRLDRGRYGAARVRDLLGRAYCALGSTQRIRSLLRQAEATFQEAKHELSQGTDDPLLRAHVLLNEASVYGEQGRYQRAFGLLDQVARISRRFDDRHLQGKAAINKGLFSSYAQDLEKALRYLDKGIRLVDVEREPRLLMAAWHNIVLCLSFLGRNQEALDKLPYVRRLHDRYGTTLDRIRLHWIEGRIAADLGQWERAQQTLEETRSQLIEAEIGYDAAMVSLELASLYLKQGRGDRVRRLAEEMLPIFKSRDVHRWVIAALIVFHKAVEKETVDLRLVQDLEQYLRRARTDPSLRFQPST